MACASLSFWPVDPEMSRFGSGSLSLQRSVALVAGLPPARAVLHVEMTGLDYAALQVGLIGCARPQRLGAGGTVGPLPSIGAGSQRNLIHAIPYRAIVSKRFLYRHLVG